VFFALLAAPAHAQQPGPAPDPQHHASPSSGPATSPAPDAKPMAMPMMAMCRQMMGDMTAMPMMGAGASTDPKERAAMLEMHGEMMKAMGDIMAKHARRMQSNAGK
jgi:hypothetical protein